MRDCVIGFRSLLCRNWTLERRINRFEDISRNRGELIIYLRHLFIIRKFRDIFKRIATYFSRLRSLSRIATICFELYERSRFSKWILWIRAILLNSIQIAGIKIIPNVFIH